MKGLVNDMGIIKRLIFLMLVTFICTLIPSYSFAAEKEETENEFSLPKNVFSLTKENTHKNTLEDESSIEPSDLTKELIDDTSVKITNQNMIKMLNETSLKPSPISFGYRGMIYLGRWALNYESKETTVNWEYQQVNTNELNNIGGNHEELLQYVQQGDKEVNGVLTSKIAKPDDVRQMMLTAVKQATDLPVTFQTKVGNNTKKSNKYNVPVKKHGFLHAYVPAVHEKGNITFGEVYVQLKGSKKSLLIKNVTKQTIGAWMPLHDHVSIHVQLQ